MFRVLNKEELKKLSHEERVEYTRQLIEHVNRVTADIEKSIESRQDRHKKPG